MYAHAYLSYIKSAREKLNNNNKKIKIDFQSMYL